MQSDRYGTLGVGGGFALGVKLAKPDAEVWVLWGDGALGYSVMEYDTFKRHSVNVIGLCGNDACWGQIERDQTDRKVELCLHSYVPKTFKKYNINYIEFQ